MKIPIEAEVWCPDCRDGLERGDWPSYDGRIIEGIPKDELYYCFGCDKHYHLQEVAESNNPITNLEGKILELIKERQKMMKGENILDLKYDKGYIHACGEILDYIRSVESNKCH